MACPGRDKECLMCNKKGHFSKHCKVKYNQVAGKSMSSFKGKKPNIHIVIENDSTNDDDKLAVSGGNLPKVGLEIEGVQNVQMIVDSGACCNVIDREL